MVDIKNTHGDAISGKVPEGDPSPAWEHHRDDCEMVASVPSLERHSFC
ncbi:MULTISPECIES: hypothetical protein [unclassified Rothia (in: high G+C Gram-positive bacteria)]|nr:MULTISPECIES: hypothetical protein [unclassified Rothia (in: high G+C Gram-positive bacteria)]MBM7052100.1 hypothetical protein [Rothia sp. ZJ1223]QRZ61466.1 hypothetical protein JR346_09635 [Rothia sp. ZJ932]